MAPLDVASVPLASGVTLSCATRGRGDGPALLLVPGPTDSWRSYAPVLDRLPESVRAVAVSPRGSGDSDKPPTGYGIEDLAGDVVPLLDALDIGSAVLAGHSGSCLVVRRVALDHPDRVAGLVLESSPTTLRGHPGLDELLKSVISTLQDPIDPDFARSFLADTSSDAIAPAFVDELISELRKVPARAWKEMFGSLQSYDDSAELDRIDVPTLLAWGDADGLVTRAMQHELVDRIRGAELCVYEGVGHTPRWEVPARFAADIAAFVQPR